MKKVSKAQRRHPRHICPKCINIRPKKYNIRVVGGKSNKDKRYCCVEGYLQAIKPNKT